MVLKSLAYLVNLISRLPLEFLHFIFDAAFGRLICSKLIVLALEFLVFIRKFLDKLLDILFKIVDLLLFTRD